MAIVLPDGSYYSFTYEPVYANLTQVRLPTGATINYSWTNYLTTSDTGFVPVPIQRRLSKRTVNIVSDAGSYPTSYYYSPAPGPTAWATQDQYTVITYPDGHDEQHSITSGQDVLDIVYNGCAEQHAGCGASGSILKATERGNATTNVLPTDQAPWSGITDGQTQNLLPGSFPNFETTIWPLTTVTTWGNLLKGSSRITKVNHVYEQSATCTTSGHWIPATNSGSSIGLPPYLQSTDNSCWTARLVSSTYFDGLSTASPAPLRTDLTHYLWMDNCAYGAAYLLGLPSESCSFAGAPTVTNNVPQTTCPSSGMSADTQYRYDCDGTGLGSPQCTATGVATGDHTATIRYSNIAAGTKEATQTSWDVHGMPTYSYDGLVNQTSYAYNSSGMLSSVADANGVKVHTYTRDLNTGLVLSDTDANAQTMSYGYDAMSRVISINHPDDTAGPAIRYTYTPYGGGYNFANVTETDAVDSTGPAKTTTTYVDGLGRLNHATVTSDPDGATTVHTAYNNMGQVGAVSTPYWGASSGPATYYLHDALGRLIDVTDPVGAVTQHTYLGEAEQIVSPSNGTAYPSRIIQHNVLGQTTDVIEVSSTTQSSTYSSTNGPFTPPLSTYIDMTGQGFQTSYYYDLNGNLTQVWQGNPNGTPYTRNFSYDNLSRLTGAFNPETGTTWTAYTYDNDDRVLTRTRPQPNAANIGSGALVTTNYSYSNLGHLTKVAYSDGSTPTAYFDWNVCGPASLCVPTQTGGNNLYGRIADSNTLGPAGRMLSGHGYAYDPMGRTTKANQCTGLDSTASTSCIYNSNTTSFLYDTSFAYNYAGDLNSEQWLDSVDPAIMMTYGYSAADRLTSVTDKTANLALLSTVTYTPAGKLNTAKLGTNETETNYYDNGASWIGSFVYNGSQELYGFSLGDGSVGPLAPNGDVQCAFDTVNGYRNFTYDDLDRLRDREIGLPCGILQ